MASGVYISKYLTREQLKFIKLIDENEISYFKMHKIEEQLNKEFANLNEILENLVDKDFLVRIERGKYRRYDFSDPYVLGTFIAKKGIVSYWSALHIHGLIERFPNIVFVKTPYRKRNTMVAGTKVKFVSVKKEKMAGITNSGYGNKRFPLTNIEMTLVDCFDQNRYAGPLPDLFKAFKQAPINPHKLIKYTNLYNNISIIKRMGCLAELLREEELSDFISFAQKSKNSKYNLFDPGGENTGDFNNRWKLRMNLSTEAILDMAGLSY
jgi:predicted transcriptional regulator of viral defense system